MLEVNVNSELFKLITARAKKEHLPKSTVLYDLYSTHEYIYLSYF